MFKSLRICLFLLLSLSLALAGNAKAVQDGRTRILFKTTKGNITIALYDETPLHRDNMIKLAKSHYYDSLLFHRVIRDFMIQTGDPQSRNAGLGDVLGAGSPDYTVPAEIKFPLLYHRRGAVAAARMGDNVNPERKSSGSQFYIVWGQEFSSKELEEMLAALEERNHVVFPESVRKDYLKNGGTPFLDGSYTVFGEVVEGMKIVDKIREVRVDQNDRPFDDIRILETEVINEPK